MDDRVRTIVINVLTALIMASGVALIVTVVYVAIRWLLQNTV